MPNPRQFVRQTAAVLLACVIILCLLPGFAAAKDKSTRETLPAENGKQFRLCAEILSYALESPEYESFMQSLEKAIPEYGIDEIWIHGFNLIDDWVTWSEFPKLRRELDAGRVAAYRKQLQRLKKHGVRITLSGRGPDVPDGFFEAYPLIMEMVE